VLTAHVIQDRNFESRLAPEWDALLDSVPSATPFQSRHWVGAWWRAFGARKQPHVIEVRETSGELVGLVPLYRTRFPWRALRPMGTGVSDYLDPLCQAGRENECVAALAEMLAEPKGVDLVDLHQWREPWAERLQSASSAPLRRIADEACYTLDLPSTWDEYVAGLSKSLRYEARRLDKAPYACGQADVRTLTDPEEVREGLEALFDLHAKRWRKRGLPGVFALSRVRRFHHSYAKAALEAGHLRLSAIRSGDVIVGVIYAMAIGDRVFFYQSGFDPEAKTLSPGTVLVAHTLREAIRDGARTFDFLRGDEPYKLRWQPQHRSVNSRLMLPLRRPLGQAGATVNRWRVRLEARIRTRIASRA